MSWYQLANAARPLFLVWIAGIFVWIAWRALSPRRKQRLQQDAMIPFKDDAQ